MSHWSSDDDFTDEDRALWDTFADVHRLRFDHKDPSDCDAALGGLRDALLWPKPVAQSGPLTLRQRARKAVLRLAGRSEGGDACIEWLRKTGQFSETELRTIRRAGLFVEDSAGRALMREAGLSPLAAAIYLGILCFLSGMWVAWVLVTDNVGLQLIVNSLALGLVLGTIAGRVIDRSFRFERLRAKVAFLAPWVAQPTRR